VVLFVFFALAKPFIYRYLRLMTNDMCVLSIESGIVFALVTFHIVM
jgi:hypothetical protein